MSGLHCGFVKRINVLSNLLFHFVQQIKGLHFLTQSATLWCLIERFYSFTLRIKVDRQKTGCSLLDLVLFSHFIGTFSCLSMILVGIFFLFSVKGTCLSIICKACEEVSIYLLWKNFITFSKIRKALLCISLYLILHWEGFFDAVVVVVLLLLFFCNLK